MAIRTWKSRALAVAQRTKVRISGTANESTDVTFTMNKKSVTIEMAVTDEQTDDPIGICDRLAEKLNELKDNGQFPELTGITITSVAKDTEDAFGSVDAFDHVLFVADNPGIPFEISVSAGTPSVDVDVTTQGVAGVDAVFEFYLTDTTEGDAEGGTFFVRWDPLGTGDETSTLIDYDTHTATAVKNAIVGGMPSVEADDITITGEGTEDDPYILTCHEDGDLAGLAMDPPEVICTGVLGGGTATITTVRNAATTASGSGFLVIETPSGSSSPASLIVDTPLGSGTIFVEADTLASTIEDYIEAIVGIGNISIVGGGSTLVTTSGSGAAGNTRLNCFGYRFKGDLEGAENCNLAVGGDYQTNNIIVNHAAAGSQHEHCLVFLKGDGGTFTLTFDGQTTGSITINDSVTATSAQTALEALSNIAPGEVTVTLLAEHGTGADSPEVWLGVSFNGGTLANTNVGTFSATVGTATTATATKVADGGATALPEIQSFWTNATGGSTTITITSVGTTDTIAMPTNATVIKSRLDAILSTDTSSVTGSGTQADPFVVTFGGSTNYAQMTLATDNIAAGAVVATVTETTEGVTAAAAVFSIVVNGTGGAVIYKFKEVATSAIAYNANAATLQSALEGLSSIGSGQVTVSGAGTSGSPYVVTLGSNFAGVEVPKIVADNSALTGSAEPTVTTTTVVAATGPWHWDNVNNWEDESGATGIPANGDDVRFERGGDEDGPKYGLDQSAVTIKSLTMLRTFTGGIGLPRDNTAGYPEYLRQYLKIGFATTKTIEIGLGDGSGTQMVKIDANNTQVLVTIWQTGGNLDPTMPCVSITNTAASSTFMMYSGEAGMTIENGQSATFADVNAYSGKLVMGKGTNVTGNLRKGPGATLLSYGATVGSVPLWLTGDV